MKKWEGECREGGARQTWVRKEICRMRRRGGELRDASVADG